MIGSNVSGPKERSWEALSLFGQTSGRYFSSRELELNLQAARGLSRRAAGGLLTIKPPKEAIKLAKGHQPKTPVLCPTGNWLAKEE